MDIKFSNIALIMCVFAVGVLACGCGDVVNTKMIPGQKYTNMLKSLPKNSQTVQSTEPKNGLTKTKSGVYIYKDNSVINTTGYDFKERRSYDVGPKDVTFDAEKSNLRY